MGGHERIPGGSRQCNWSGRRLAITPEQGFCVFSIDRFETGIVQQRRSHRLGLLLDGGSLSGATVSPMSRDR